MSSRPSIKDIALLAGVAPSTVSRALADSSRVSEQTRQRVQTIAKQIGYTPSAAARSLVTGSSHTLGIVVPSLGDPYVAAVVAGIEQAAIDANYHLLVASTGGDADREIACIRLLVGQQPDGLIVLSSRVGQAYHEFSPNFDIPLVLVNSIQPGNQVFSIATDNEYGAWQATRHLLDLNHRRIAYLGGPSSGRSQQARLAGYRRALQDGGEPYDADLVLPGDGSIAAGQQALRQLWTMPVAKRPTAIFCYNDLSALGLLAEAYLQSVHVPADLAVIGFDNLPLSSISLPPLTTIDQRKEEMGRLAVETILAARRHEPVCDVQLRGDLILRQSTAPIPQP